MISAMLGGALSNVTFDPSVVDVCVVWLPATSKQIIEKGITSG